MRAPPRLLALLVTGAVLLAGCSAAEPGTPRLRSGPGRRPRPAARPRSTPTDGATEPEAEQPEADVSDEPEPPARPVSVLGLAEQRHRGDRLTLGAVRERTAAYTSYDVTYRSRSTADSEGEEAEPDQRGPERAPGRGRSRPSCSRTATSTRRTTSAGRE